MSLQDGCDLILSASFLQDTASYDDDNLVVWSMRLLNRFFSSESEVFEKAKDTRVRLRGLVIVHHYV